MLLARRFQNFDNFIFDLDGTVWKWTELIPGAIKVFQVLRRYDKNIFFLTNNTLLTREGFVKKLQNFEIDAVFNQVINPAIAAVNLFAGKKVFCIAEGLVTELRKARIKVVEHGAEAVVVAEDRTFTYDKLAKACNAIFSGAKFYKTAEGGVWFYGKKRLPGAGAIAAPIELCTGKCGELLGKPSCHMVKIIKQLNLKPEKTVLLGDECTSDIVFGNKLGFTTALVLTGRDSEKDYLLAKGECEPRLLLKSIAEIVK